MRLCWECY